MAYASWSVVFGEQPTAAKWNILGTNDASFNDGTGLNTGSVQQIQVTQSTAVATGTTTIPSDDTIPQITEGTEFITTSITPKATTNTLVVTVNCMVSYSVTARLIGALFQDATANALASTEVFIGTGTTCYPLVLQYSMAAGTTSSTTFRFRAGSDSAGTVTLNGYGGARKYGAINKSSIVICEHKS